MFSEGYLHQINTIINPVLHNYLKILDYFYTKRSLEKNCTKC